MSQLTKYEEQRLALQSSLDCKKTQAERNKLGQFATPPALAREMVAYGKQLLPEGEQIRFLDPAIGTGSFYSSFMEVVERKRTEIAEGFEVDEHYGKPAKSLWRGTPLKIHIADFTLVEPPKSEVEKFNLLICNPPYVRHHHIINGEKERLRDTAERSCGIRFNGLSGLYCYFMGIAHSWIKKGGVAGWLIPAEFMDVNYGESLKLYLLNQVTLLRIHRFDPNDVQFEDAQVSSAIVFYRNEKPASNYNITFTFGGTLAKPNVSQQLTAKKIFKEKKWNRLPLLNSGDESEGITLSSLFTVKRGLATGDNSFFILTPEQIRINNLPMKFFRPILPSPRYLPSDEIFADIDGNPAIDRQLFLLDCNLPEELLKTQYHSLWRYLETGKPKVTDRYLCKKRTPWYSQERRLHSQFICTYMGRRDLKKNRPFRFILNHSRATAANVYLLLYPKPFLKNALSRDPELVRSIWQRLNQISPEVLLGEGRVYGGGLYKLEPRELANIPADQLLDFVPEEMRRIPKQLKLFNDEDNR